MDRYPSDWDVYAAGECVVWYFERFLRRAFCLVGDQETRPVGVTEDGMVVNNVSWWNCSGDIRMNLVYSPETINRLESFDVLACAVHTEPPFTTVYVPCDLGAGRTVRMWTRGAMTELQDLRLAKYRRRLGESGLSIELALADDTIMEGYSIEMEFPRGYNVY